jgi:hypothetical protein
MTGLAASFWSNGQAAGPVAVHANGPGGTQPQSLCGATSGRLCAHWNAGAPPVTSDASGHWSLRLTGTITLASAGTYNLGVASSQATTVAYDGTRACTTARTSAASSPNTTASAQTMSSADATGTCCVAATCEPQAGFAAIASAGANSGTRSSRISAPSSRAPRATFSASW